MNKTRAYLGRIAMISASILLVASALHYPFATTFPIGGDAMSYIRDSRRLVTAAANPSQLVKPSTYSRYPAAQAVFATFAAIPIPWPERYTWFASLSFIASGLALGWLGYRIAGWQTAAIAAVAWSTTLVSIQPHIESGTIAQLFSLAPLFLFFERLYSKSYVSAIAFLLLALAAHPITGIVGLLSAYTAVTVAYKQDKKILQRFALPLIGVTIFALISLASIKSFFANVPPSDQFTSLPNSIRSWVSPLWILSPIGFILLIRKIRENPAGTSAVISFTFLSFLFTANNYLEIGVWTDRFETYLISALILLFAITLPRLLTSALPQKFLQTALACLILITMFIPGWASARGVFAYYESPGRYARLHREEQSAFEWMAGRLPENSRIISTQENRHTEWIPVMTPFQWTGIHGNIPMETLNDNHHTHVIYLKKREEVPTQVRSSFPVIYETDSAAIFELTP